jgi:hypothetical protein
VFSDPEEIVLGPPRTSFASASMRSNKLGDLDRLSKDTEPRDRPDRMARNKTDTDVIGSFRDGRNQNSALRRRGDTDQDSEGWSTVLPRKSFGHEGAERFQGRMGGGLDRMTPRDDRKRDRDDRDTGDRRNRTFDQQSRDKDGEDPEGSRWNGLNSRTKTEREPRGKETSEGAPLTQRERIDRARSWRERIPDDKPAERHNDRQNDRQNDRGYDRRHDRDHRRSEREPEWDDPHEELKAGAHNLDDFKKFMELQRARDKPNSASVEKPGPVAEPTVEIKKKVVSVSAIEMGPDKFFASLGGGAALEVASPAPEARDSGDKPKPAAKSKFASFFSPREPATGGKPDLPTLPAAPPFSAYETQEASEADRKALESQAFQQNILQKLQKQVPTPLPETSRPSPPTRATPSFSEHSSGLGSGSLAGLFPSLTSGPQHSSSAVASPVPFQQYGGAERRDDPRNRHPQQQQQHMGQEMRQEMGQDMLSPRPTGPPSQPPAARPEPNLHELLYQRHLGYGNMPAGRMEQSPGPVINKDNSFLLQLMKSRIDAPDPLRTEQHMAGMPQTNQRMNHAPSAMNQGRPLSNIPSNELDMQRERERNSSHRQMRPNGPPDFFDQFHPSENDNRPQQPHPTQILQRPPPPGLDHHFAQLQMGGPGPMPPQRPMIPPPPGLINRDPRNPNIGPGPVQGMFPPNFGPGGFPPGANGLPEGLLGPGPGPAPGVGGPGGQRNMPPPPGFFSGGPPVPPGFMMSGLPPPNMGGGFPPQGGPGPDFGMPLPPFDGRNMPLPPGAPVGPFRRP